MADEQTPTDPLTDDDAAQRFLAGRFFHYLAGASWESVDEGIDICNELAAATFRDFQNLAAVVRASDTTGSESDRESLTDLFLRVGHVEWDRVDARSMADHALAWFASRPVASGVTLGGTTREQIARASADPMIRDIAADAGCEPDYVVKRVLLALGTVLAPDDQQGMSRVEREALLRAGWTVGEVNAARDAEEGK